LNIQQQIEKTAYHNIEIANILKWCNPLGVWADAGDPITKDEVFTCLANNKEELVKTDFYFGTDKDEREKTRTNHIKKVAYFVKNKVDKPIDIEISSEANYHLISDGNHRLAGRWLAGDAAIKSNVFGFIDLAKDMNLWNPNKDMEKLSNLYDQEMQKETSKQFRYFLKKLNKDNSEKKYMVTITQLERIDYFSAKEWKENSFEAKVVKILESVNYRDLKHNQIMPGPFVMEFKSKKDEDFVFQKKNKLKIK
jgi:hypothetical protein